MAINGLYLILQNHLEDIVCMGLTISIDQNGDSQKYLDLKTALSNFFNNTTIDKLFNLTDDNAIGFCRATKSGTTTKIMGSFKQSFNPIGGNWIVNGTGTKSYSGYYWKLFLWCYCR